LVRGEEAMAKASNPEEFSRLAKIRGKGQEAEARPG